MASQLTNNGLEPIAMGSQLTNNGLEPNSDGLPTY